MSNFERLIVDLVERRIREHLIFPMEQINRANANAVSALETAQRAESLAARAEDMAGGTDKRLGELLNDQANLRSHIDGLRFDLDKANFQGQIDGLRRGLDNFNRALNQTGEDQPAHEQRPPAPAADAGRPDCLRRLDQHLADLSAALGVQASAMRQAPEANFRHIVAWSATLHHLRQLLDRERESLAALIAQEDA